MVNYVNPDQTPYSVVFDLDLHCLLSLYVQTLKVNMSYLRNDGNFCNILEVRITLGDVQKGFTSLCKLSCKLYLWPSVVHTSMNINPCHAE